MTATLHLATRESAVYEVPSIIGELTKPLSGQDTFALITTPVAYDFGIWKDGQLDCRATIEDAFEIRAFNRHWELRWIRDGLNGAAMLLADNDLGLDSGWDCRQFSLETKPWERRYLLWGTTARQCGTSGWTELTNGRTSPIRIPLTFTKSGLRVYLVAHEYTARFSHGNVCVFEQRLTEISTEPESDSRHADE